MKVTGEKRYGLFTVSEATEVLELLDSVERCAGNRAELTKWEIASRALCIRYGVKHNRRLRKEAVESIARSKSE